MTEETTGTKEDARQIYTDGDGVPLNDTYHRNGYVIEDLPDGVYVDCPNYVYFAQDRLGSSDLKQLAADDPESWWWGSRHNPDREETESEEDLLFGRAMHCRLLEGEAVFEASYVTKPDVYINDKNETKPWNANANVCKAWEEEQRRAGVTTIKPKTMRNVLLLSNVILKHKVFKDYVTGGMAELTVLFTVGGLKFRARLDKIKFSGGRGLIIDLKSQGRHANSTVSPLYLADKGLTRDQHTSLRIIRDMRYSIQRYLYGLGRQFLADFVHNHSDATPRVFGASPRQMTFLQNVADEEVWDFAFLFMRKVSNSSKSPSAPIITPIISTPQDGIDIKGHLGFEVACENYTRLVEDFGLDVGWARHNPPYTVQDQHIMDIFGGIGDQPPIDNEGAESDDDSEDEAAA